MAPRMAFRTALLALPLFLAACHDKLENPIVERAWVRLPAVPGRPAAAYFQITGNQANDVHTKLVKIESALAQRTEMHESMSTPMGGMTMAPIAFVDIPPYIVTEFKPGGRHAMLIGLDKVVTPGTAVPLRFGFADGKVAEAEAKTVSAGEDAPY